MGCEQTNTKYLGFRIFKKIQEPVDGWVGGWVSQIWFENLLWLSSELSLDSESKFKPSVARMEFSKGFVGVYLVFNLKKNTLKLSRRAIWQVSEDLYHNKFVSWPVDHCHAQPKPVSQSPAGGWDGLIITTVGNHHTQGTVVLRS